VGWLGWDWGWGLWLADICWSPRSGSPTFVDPAQISAIAHKSVRASSRPHRVSDGCAGRRGRPGWMAGVPKAHKDTHGNHQQERCTTSSAAPHKRVVGGKRREGNHDMSCCELQKESSHLKETRGHGHRHQLNQNGPESTCGITRNTESCAVQQWTALLAALNTFAKVMHHLLHSGPCRVLLAFSCLPWRISSVCESCSPLAA